MTNVENGSPLALSVRDLCVGYSSLPPAVDSVSFSLGRGQRMGIIGESGSGKSTLGVALMGLLPITGNVREGSILIDGANMVGVPERSRRALRGRKVSLIYQDASSSLDPLKRIGKQIEEAIRSHDRRAKDVRTRTARAMTEVGLTERNLRNYPHELSGGMRQRVTIAMALVNDPVLVVADEPTTALDVTTQARVLDLLEARVADRNAALLLITHDLGVVADRCELTGVMYKGRLVEWGHTSRILGSPEHPYTRALVACSDALMNSAEERLPTLASWGLADEYGGTPVV